MRSFLLIIVTFVGAYTLLYVAFSNMTPEARRAAFDRRPMHPLYPELIPPEDTPRRPTGLPPNVQCVVPMAPNSRTGVSLCTSLDKMADYELARDESPRNMGGSLIVVIRPANKPANDDAARDQMRRVTRYALAHGFKVQVRLLVATHCMLFCTDKAKELAAVLADCPEVQGVGPFCEYRKD